METISTIIVDDHKICRVGLEFLLDEIDFARVDGMASNGEELFELLKKTEPDIVFMDFFLGDENGAELTKKILSKYQNTYVIAVTSSKEISAFIEMIDAGATGFLLKNVTEDELATAIQEVIQGSNYFSKELLQFARQLNRPVGKKKAIRLNSKETDVLKLLCEGYSTQEIADSLQMSYHTVDSYRRSLFQKTGARNAASLVLIAARENLINLNE